MPVSMIGPKFYAWDPDTGLPLALGKVYTYAAGTSTPKATYTTEEGDVANTNPVILNAAGYASIKLDGSYKIVVKDADDVEIWTEDPVSDASQLGLEWINQRDATQTSATTFTITGNHTAQYVPGRRVKLEDATTLYGSIDSSSYGGGVTTVTVTVDEAEALTAALSASYVSLFTGIGSSTASGINTATTATMKLLSPSAGTAINTSDHRSTQRGGGAPYLTKTAAQASADGDVVDGYGNHAFANGNIAVLQVGTTINPRQFGVAFDGVTDDTAALSAMRTAYPDKIYILPQGSYLEDGIVKINAEPTAVSTLGKGLDKTPFYLMWSGQSNASGAAEVPVGFIGTSNEVEDGVYVWSNSANEWLIPVWGDNPLTSSGSNNAGIRCANEIKRRTGRDVYMILNSRGGLSIEEWMGLGTSSDMWDGNQKDIVSQLTNSGMPRIDAVGWMQGEADHDTAGGNYNTYGLYKAALETLIAQYKALSQWTDHTKFVTSGIGEWYDLLTFARNDVLLTLNNWTDTVVGNISTNGSARNPDSGQQSHFSHDSLTLVGKRMAVKFLGEAVGAASVYTSNRPMQGATLPRSTSAIDTTLNADPQDLKGGAYINAANGIINLPDAYRFDGAEIVVNVSAVTTDEPTIVSMAATSSIVYNGVTQASISCDRQGHWIFKSLNGTLYLISKPDRISNYAEYSVFSETRLVSLSELNNSVWRVNDAILQLPDPATLTNIAFSVISTTATTSSVVVPSETNIFYNKTGAVVTSLTLSAAGNIIRLRAMNTRWAVEFQNY